MVFSSLTFLYYFLPAVLVFYFLAPKNFKNAVLLLSSLCFYAWGEPRYVILMVVSIVCGYIYGLLIERFAGSKLSKVFMIISVAVSLSFLLFFKYSNFFSENFSKVTGISISLLKVTLPVGISFYTFQIISYTVDVYRKAAKAQRNIIDLAAYISLFPQLIAGPIVRYTDIYSQLHSRSHTIEKVSSGIKLFVTGLSKKIFIANALGQLCEVYYESEQQSVVFSWIYAVSYSLQVYFDFSGYSDMAIGLGRIFGFNFCKNFDYPYISGSISEFWRRWHISLGSWFRDYVYIPLGGNRTTRIKQLRNILVVWAITGLWHGASWIFVIWGLYFAVLLAFEKVFIGNFLKKHRLSAHIYVILTVLISFVIFSSLNIKDALECILVMFNISEFPVITAEHMYYIRSFALILIIAVIGATPFPNSVFNRIKNKRYINKIIVIFEPVAILMLTFLCTAYLVDGSFNPFLYFRF
ncbi:MAG: MBOAT family protein [Ruminococcus sp.]|nr:MBOAT family protein [Ruminococcus sp.]